MYNFLDLRDGRLMRARINYKIGIKKYPNSTKKIAWRPKLCCVVAFVLHPKYGPGHQTPGSTREPVRPGERRITEAKDLGQARAEFYRYWNPVNSGRMCEQRWNQIARSFLQWKVSFEIVSPPYIGVSQGLITLPEKNNYLKRRSVQPGSNKFGIVQRPKFFKRLQHPVFFFADPGGTFVVGLQSETKNCGHLTKFCDGISAWNLHLCQLIHFPLSLPGTI